MNTTQWKSEVTAIGIAVCAAAIFDVYCLTSQSLWMDEGFSVFMAQNGAASFWHFVRGGEVNMFLYYALLRMWLHFGISEFWVRLFSVIWGVATVPVVYAIGKRLSGGLTGGMAALLFAVHPSEVTFAQEARSYSLAVFLVSVSCLFFLRSLEDSGRLTWAGYVIFSALSAYTHLFAILIIAAQWIWLLVFFRPRMLKRSQLKAAAVLVFSLLPLIIVVYRHGHGAADWIPRATVSAFVQVWSLLTLPHRAMFLYLSLWIVAIGRTLIVRQRSTELRHIGFAACWLFVPVMLTLGICFYKSMLVPRFLLVCLPASVLLVAHGITRFPRPVAVGAFGVLLFASFNALLSYYRHLGWKEDWRAATAYVVSQYAPGDKVVIVPTYGRFTFGYYCELWGGVAQSILYEELNPDGPGPTSATGHRIWLVISAIGSRLPETQKALHSLTSCANPSSRNVVENQHFNSIDVLLLKGDPGS